MHIKLLHIIILLICIVFIPDLLFAQTNDIRIDVISQITEQVRVSVGRWEDALKKTAVNIFGILAVIGFFGKFILEIMNKGNIEPKESIAFLFRFMLVTGFFFFLLNNGIDFGELIVKSFVQYAYGATHMPEFTLSTFGSIFGKIWNMRQHLSFFDTGIFIVFAVLALLNFIFLLIIFVSLIIEEIAVTILIYAGYFVLALGGMDYTRESAIGFFKAVLGAALKIFTILLLLAITMSILNSFERSVLTTANKISADEVLMKALISFVTTFVMALLVMKIPDAVANLVSSAWGNMGGLQIMSAMRLAMSTASGAMNVANKVSNAAGKGIGNFAAGVKDHGVNKEKGKIQQAMIDAGDMTAKFNPMFNKQKTGSGKSYYAGKASAKGAEMIGQGISKVGSIFGKSNEMSDQKSDNLISNSEEKKDGDNNTNINNNSSNNQNSNNLNNSNQISSQSSNSNTSNTNVSTDKKEEETPVSNNKSETSEINNKEIDNKQESPITKGGTNV